MTLISLLWAFVDICSFVVTGLRQKHQSGRWYAKPALGACVRNVSLLEDYLSHVFITPFKRRIRGKFNTFMEPTVARAKPGNTALTQA